LRRKTSAADDRGADISKFIEAALPHPAMIGAGGYQLGEFLRFWTVAAKKVFPAGQT
jgi:hypothetical protein